MFEVRFKGLRLIPSKSSSDEMVKLGLMLYDCKNMLEKGVTKHLEKEQNIQKKFGLIKEIKHITW